MVDQATQTIENKAHDREKGARSLSPYRDACRRSRRGAQSAATRLEAPRTRLGAQEPVTKRIRKFGSSRMLRVLMQTTERREFVLWSA